MNKISRLNLVMVLLLVIGFCSTANSKTNGIPIIVYSSDKLKEVLVSSKVDDPPKIPSNFSIIDEGGKACPVQIDDLDGSGTISKEDEVVFQTDLEKGLNIFYIASGKEETKVIPALSEGKVTVKGSIYQATVDTKAVIKGLQFLKEDGTVVPGGAIGKYEFGFVLEKGYVSPAEKIRTISFCSGPLRTIVVAGGDYKSEKGGKFYSLHRVELRKDSIRHHYTLRFLDGFTRISGQIQDGTSYDPKFFTEMRYLIPDETTGDLIVKTEEIEKCLADKELSHGDGNRAIWSDLRGPEYGLVDFRKRPLRRFKWWKGIRRVAFYSWPGAKYCEGDEVIDEGMLFPYLSKKAPDIESLTKRFQADISASMKIETLEAFLKLKEELVEYNGYLNILKVGLPAFKKELDIVKDVDSKLNQACSLWQSGKIAECRTLFNKTVEEFGQLKEKLRETIPSALDNWWLAEKKDLEKSIEYLKNNNLNFATPQIMLSNAEVCKNAAKLYFKKMSTPLIEVCKSRPYPRAIEEIQRAFSLCKNAEEAIKVIKEGKIKNLLPEKEVKNPLFYFTIHATGIFPEYRWLNPPVQKKRTLEIWDEFKAIGLDVMCGGLSVETIEPEEGKFNLDWMKEAVEECRKRDIKLVPYLGLWGTGGACGHHFTFLEWFQKKYKDARPVLAVEKYVGTLPVYDMLDEFQKAVMDAIGKQPNIIAWCGNNETAAWGRGYDEHSIKSFQGWLKDKHGTINHLNECWGTKLLKEGKNLIAVGVFNVPGSSDAYMDLELGSASVEELMLSKGSSNWKYTVDYPQIEPPRDKEENDWYELGYDDTSWKEGDAPFGYGDEPKAKYGMKLPATGGSYYFRKELELKEAGKEKIFLKVASDNAAIVYINGKLVHKDPRYGIPGDHGHDFKYWNSEQELPLPYSSFDEINPPDYKGRAKGIASSPTWYDWILFRAQALGSTDAIVTAMIQRNDPLKRPASPRGLSETFMVMGPDPAYRGFGSHYNQYSSDWWYFDQACRDVFFFNNYTHDSYEVPWMVNGAWSASKGKKPILITEAGPCAEHPPFYWGIPKPEELNYYWQGVGQGLKGAHLESYGTSDTANRCYYHRDGSPKDTLLRIGEINQIAKVLKPLLADAKPEKAEVAIYYPRATMIHDGSGGGVFSWGRFSQLWRSFYKSGISVEFLAMDTIDEVKDYKVLILHSTAYLEGKCISPIKEFVKNGGLLIAEGALSFWNEYGKEYKKASGGLMEVFGAEIDTTGQNDAEVEITDGLLGRKVGAKVELNETRFSYSLKPKTAKVLAKYSGGGKPAIVYNQYHKGKAILFGYPTANLKEDLTHTLVTELWGEYVPRGDKGDGLIVSVIKQGEVSRPISWKGDVEISLLWNQQIPIIIVVSNLNKEEEVELRHSFGREYGDSRWFDILTSKQLDKSKETLGFKMSPYQVRIIVPEG